jgi:hypothetical protein
MSVNAEEPTYENPELQLKFNLKEDKESLTPQNKLPMDPEAHSTGRAEYTQYPLFRTDRQPTQVGTWTSDPVEFDMSINIETTDIWWEVKGEDYEPDCEWTFYIHHNDQQVSENTEACQGDGANLEKETYNIGTAIELAAGDTFALELWYEGWEDVDIYHDNVTYDTGMNVKGNHIFFFGAMWKGSEVNVEFAEAWPTNWDTNLDGGFVMLMGDEGYMADNKKAEVTEGSEYAITLTNGTAEITSTIITWTEVTGNGISLMMDYTTFDHMPAGGNGSANGTGNQAIVTVNLMKATQLLGDEDGLLGLPGFEIILAVPALAFVARRFRN